MKRITWSWSRSARQIAVACSTVAPAKCCVETLLVQPLIAVPCTMSHIDQPKDQQCRQTGCHSGRDQDIDQTSTRVREKVAFYLDHLLHSIEDDFILQYPYLRVFSELWYWSTICFVTTARVGTSHCKGIPMRGALCHTYHSECQFHLQWTWRDSPEQTTSAWRTL